MMMHEKEEGKANGRRKQKQKLAFLSHFFKLVSVHAKKTGDSKREPNEWLLKPSMGPRE
jgi:hypothetical protein